VKELNISMYFFFRPSLGGVLFPMFCLPGVSDFSVLKYYYLNINYMVNILNECLRILIDCSQLSKSYYLLFGSFTRDRHARCIYRQTFSMDEITRKASDAAENLHLYQVVRFFHRRSPCMTTHISANVQKCIVHDDLGWKTKQLDIFRCVTGFTSDFLSFIVVELIRFFHGDIHLLMFWE